MKNKLKIFALGVAVLVGMVLYKGHYDKQEELEREEERRTGKKRPERERWD